MARRKLKPRMYPIVSRAVEEGSWYGVRRAFKHTDKPSQAAIQQAVEQAVMDALCEVVDFESEAD